MGDDSEVLEDKDEGKENVECAACPTETRDAKDMQHRERLVHEIFMCSVPKQVEEGKESEVSHEMNS